MNGDLYQKYYENPVFWGRSPQEIPKGEIERINKSIAMIPKDVITILDVGCGDGEITNILAKNYQVTGLDISSNALKYVKTKVIQRSVENSNLKNNSFDLVTAFEALEHLPVESYYKACQEISRISRKYIIISVPFKEEVRGDFTKCPKCYCSFNAFRHLRSFDLPAIKALFPNFTLKDYVLVGPKIKQWGRISLFFKQNLFGCWKNTSTAVCPQCGNNKFLYPRNLFFYLIGGLYLASKVLPGRKNKKWIIAKYNKNIR